MASFDLANVGKALDDASSDESGISFAGLAKKWETEDDGKHITSTTHLCCIYAKYSFDLSERLD